MLRLLLALGVAAALVAGIWLAGGVLTNDFVASVILTGAWLAGAGLVCLALSWRHRRLRLPLLVPYALVALAATVWLGRAELFDKTVDENVVKAKPAAPSKRASEPARNTLVSRGSFESLAHESSGVASVIRTKRGKRVLTLTHFSTSNGPDLRVYLAAGPADAGDVHEFADLGALKGNKGDQQYELEGKALSRRYRTVVIWCRAFSVGFARARLSQE